MIKTIITHGVVLEKENGSPNTPSNWPKLYKLVGDIVRDLKVAISASYLLKLVLPLICKELLDNLGGHSWTQIVGPKQNVNKLVGKTTWRFSYSTIPPPQNWTKLNISRFLHTFFLTFWGHLASTGLRENGLQSSKRQNDHGRLCFPYIWGWLKLSKMGFLII